MTKSELDSVIAAIKKVRESATDETAVDAEAIYPAWRAGVDQAVGDRVRDGEKLYKCLQAHTTQEGWRPSATPALYVEVAKPGEYREIKDSMLPTEAFAYGEIGWYKEKTNLWESLFEGNTYTPITAPNWWKKVN